MRRNMRILLILLWSVAFFAMLGYNGYLLYKKVDFLEHGRGWLESLPDEFWLALGINLAKMIGLVIVASVLSKQLSKLLTRLMKRAIAFE